MSQTKQVKNKALVLAAFDTLFNKRDYVAAEKFWSPHYVNTALISRLAAMACSISLRASRQR
jgi:hypothetical protein